MCRSSSSSGEGTHPRPAGGCWTAAPGTSCRRRSEPGRLRSREDHHSADVTLPIGGGDAFAVKLRDGLPHVLTPGQAGGGAHHLGVARADLERGAALTDQPNEVVLDVLDPPVGERALSV